MFEIFSIKHVRQWQTNFSCTLIKFCKQFPNNFVRLRSGFFLHAAMPDAVFDGIRPLFRIEIPGLSNDDEILDIEVQKVDRGKFTEKLKQKTDFWLKGLRSMRRNLGYKNIRELGEPQFAILMWFYNYTLAIKQNDGTNYDLSSNRIRKLG